MSKSGAIDFDAEVRTTCQLLGLEWRGAMTASEVSRYMDAIGFVCPPGVVSEFLRKKYVDEPADCAAWTAEEVYRLASALCTRRRWKPVPCQWDGHKSVHRMRLETLGPGVLGHAMNLTVEDLLLWIVEAPTPDTRELLYECIRLKMSEAGFIEE